MAAYLSMPILDDFIHLVEHDPTDVNSLKAMSSGLLNYYFPATSGYIPAPEIRRNEGSNELIIIRIKGQMPGSRGLRDHTVIEARVTGEGLEGSLARLETALEQANTDVGRCWALLILGPTLMLYEYHRDLPEHARLVPWGPPDEQQQNSYHVRRDSVEI